MIPIKTSVEDMQKLLGYLSKQIGWVEQRQVEKALGSQDDRKVGAMVELGLVQRDGSNLKSTPRGRLLAGGDATSALREAVRDVALYWATVEWMHYQKKNEMTAAEIGQYWEASHKDTLGSLKGSTLKDGAVTFARVIEGAGFGTFIIGRGGKETRVTLDLGAIGAFVDGAPEPSPASTDEPGPASDPTPPSDEARPSAVEPAAVVPTESLTRPSVSVSSSPSVHVNVEIHIAADATADTVREIFRNMARYVLDKQVDDDGA